MQDLSEPKASVQQGTRKNPVRNAATASAMQGDPKKAPGVKGPLADALKTS